MAIVEISKIKVGNRFRQELGNVDDLAQSIQEVGILQPIVVNEDNELIVGHRRLIACKKLGYKGIPATILNLTDATEVEFHENAIRKGFTSREKIAIKKTIEKMEKAKTRVGRPRKGVESTQFNSRRKTRDRVADFFGMGWDKLEKLEDVVDAANKYPHKFGTLPEKIDSGLSTYKAYGLVKKEEKREELSNVKPNISLPTGCKLILGDFIEKSNEITNDSIDLIFTDPPYGKESIPLYKDLAKLAGKVLKKGGSLVTYAGQLTLPEVMKMLDYEGLKYWWTFCVQHSEDHQLVYARNVFCEWKPLLWFVKGEKPNIIDKISDHIESKQPEKLYKMEQSTTEAEHVIKRLTVENQIVLDTCMGIGTTGLAALKLKRKFIGIEKDENSYMMAKSRIGNMQAWNK